MIESFKVVELLTVKLKNVDQYFVAPFFCVKSKTWTMVLKKKPCTVITYADCRLQNSVFN